MKQGTPVLVTTAHRGVFFGYLESLDGTTVTLCAMRNCLYWSADMKGFLGLAVVGPCNKCRIGPPAQRSTLMDVTSINECTPAAAIRWEEAPWLA